MSHPVIDRDELEARIGADDALIRELVECFIDDAAAMVPQLREAVGSRQLGQVVEVAHGLKGAAANLSLVAMREASKELERAGRAGELPTVEKQLHSVEAAMDELRKWMSNGHLGR